MLRASLTRSKAQLVNRENALYARAIVSSVSRNALAQVFHRGQLQDRLGRKLCVGSSRARASASQTSIHGATRLQAHKLSCSSQYDE
jgi:hypothetical protein